MAGASATGMVTESPLHRLKISSTFLSSTAVAAVQPLGLSAAASVSRGMPVSFSTLFWARGIIPSSSSSRSSRKRSST